MEKLTKLDNMEAEIEYLFKFACVPNNAVQDTPANPS